MAPDVIAGLVPRGTDADCGRRPELKGRIGKLESKDDVPDDCGRS
jgi:hypothetical protein